MGPLSRGYGIYIIIKPLPVPRVFGARSGSPQTTYGKKKVIPILKNVRCSGKGHQLLHIIIIIII